MSTAPLFLNSSLPPELDGRVRSELSEDEKLLWVGQPNPRRMAKTGWWIALFGIPFFAFSIFWTVTAATFFNGAPGGAPGIFQWFSIGMSLFGIPFIIAGLGLLTAPYWLMRKARQTCYAITDRRAIVCESSWRGVITVYSYAPEALVKQYRREERDGGGDLVFEEITRVTRDSDGPSTHTTKRGFLAIDDVRTVEALLRKALPTTKPL